MPLRKGSQHSPNDFSLPQGQLAITYSIDKLTDPNRCMSSVSYHATRKGGVRSSPHESRSQSPPQPLILCGGLEITETEVDLGECVQQM